MVYQYQILVITTRISKKNSLTTCRHKAATIKTYVDFQTVMENVPQSLTEDIFQILFYNQNAN